MTPNVTVVMATYNGEAYLEEQIYSILNQTYQNFYLLISDDVSTDGTYPLLKKIETQYGNVSVQQNELRLGVVKNFENLIEAVDTEYIALADQDDIWERNKLEFSIKSLQLHEKKQEPLLFHSDLSVVNQDNELIESSFFKMRGYKFPNKKSLDIMLGRSGIMGNTMVFNQALKEKILPFPDDLIVHDYWIALVNESEGKRLTSMKNLISYRIHTQNTSSSFREKKPSLRNLTLPYHEIKRESVLDELKKRFDIASKELTVINRFIDYLEFKKDKFYLSYLVLKYDFFRVGVLYKLKLIGAILWKHR